MRGERRKEKEQESKEMVLVGPLPGACSSHLSNPAGRSRRTRSSQQPAQQIRKDFVSYRLCRGGKTKYQKAFTILPEIAFIAFSRKGARLANLREMSRSLGGGSCQASQCLGTGEVAEVAGIGNRVVATPNALSFFSRQFEQ